MKRVVLEFKRALRKQAFVGAEAMVVAESVGDLVMQANQLSNAIVSMSRSVAKILEQTRGLEDQAVAETVRRSVRTLGAYLQKADQALRGARKEATDSLQWLDLG